MTTEDELKKLAQEDAERHQIGPLDPTRRRLTDEEWAMFSQPYGGWLPLRVVGLVADGRRARADRAQLVDALQHMRWCHSCAEGSWASCEEGRKAEALLAELGAAPPASTSTDAPSAG